VRWFTECLYGFRFCLSAGLSDRTFLLRSCSVFLQLFRRIVLFWDESRYLSPCLRASVSNCWFSAQWSKNLAGDLELIGGAFLTGFRFSPEISNFVFIWSSGDSFFTAGSAAAQDQGAGREFAAVLAAATAALLPPLLWMARKTAQCWEI